MCLVVVGQTLTCVCRSGITGHTIGCRWWGAGVCCLHVVVQILEATRLVGAVVAMKSAVDLLSVFLNTIFAVDLDIACIAM